MELKTKWFKAFPRTRLNEFTSKYMQRQISSLSSPMLNELPPGHTLESFLGEVSANLAFALYLRHTVVDSRSNVRPWFMKDIGKTVLELDEFKQHNQETLSKFMMLKGDRNMHSLTYQLTLIQHFNFMEFTDG